MLKRSKLRAVNRSAKSAKPVPFYEGVLANMSPRARDEVINAETKKRWEPLNTRAKGKLERLARERKDRAVLESNLLKKKRLERRLSNKELWEKTGMCTISLGETKFWVLKDKNAPNGFLTKLGGGLRDITETERDMVALEMRKKGLIK